VAAQKYLLRFAILKISHLAIATMFIRYCASAFLSNVTQLFTLLSNYVKGKHSSCICVVFEFFYNLMWSRQSYSANKYHLIEGFSELKLCFIKQIHWTSQVYWRDHRSQELV